MRTFFADLTGANCTLGGQTIIDLRATEDVDADYDTASAVCLAPGGPWPRGTVVHSIEGGTSTGYWEVEDPVTSRSGERTWRRRAGAGYAHLPLVSYKLRRRGYMRARTTLSKSVVGADNYPPKFCTMTRMSAIVAELQEQYAARAIDTWEFRKQREAWRSVYGAEYIVTDIARWVGLSVQFRTRLSACADEYIPVDKPAITAIREVAAWSGASVLLDRNGVLQIFDWQHTYGRGGSRPSLPAVLEEETHDSLSSINEVTVIGNTYSPENTRRRYGNRLWPLEVTERLALASGEGIVSQRIEVREYPVSPNMAQQMARERLARAYLANNAGVWRGPAEGCQGLRPLENRVLSVNRVLTWTGNAYRYEIEVRAATSGVPYGSSASSLGGWW